jgi:PAS domain S-box-containing protein
MITNRGMAMIMVWVIAALVYYAGRSRPHEERPAELLAQEDIYQAVFNQTFQFVVALDAKGDIIEANQTLLDYAGLTAGEIRSVPVWMLPIFRNDSDIQDRLREAVERAGNGDFSRDEFVVSGIGDKCTVIDFSLKPIRGSDGATERMIMEARDITEARTQQEMLVQAQKMEAVGELTSGVAHDFNNLLTVIVGNLELVQNRIQGNENARDRLRRAIEAAFRGQALTQQLLAFSRRQSLNPTVIDVNILLRGMSQLYEALGEGVIIEFDLADALPPCEVDAALLETALLNIAINARDAMPNSGTIRFETAAVTLDDRYAGDLSDLPPGDYVCLAVSDTGDGMPEEIVSNVFDPFFTTKGDDQGTGLGLSMVYGFVKQSGGDVKIYSEVGKGTTICIYLPTTDKPLPEPAETAGGVKDNVLEGTNVLLVDDDEEVRNMVLEALSEMGCAVESAEHGDAAIDLIRAGSKYDLIFTDMVMAGDPGGPDVARAARAAMPGVPVVFCSGFPRQTLSGEEASVEGAIFLAKPFHQGDLLKTIERALEQDRRELAPSP